MAAKINVTTNWNELSEEQKRKLQSMFARHIVAEMRRKEKTA